MKNEDRAIAWNYPSTLGEPSETNDLDQDLTFRNRVFDMVEIGSLDLQERASGKALGESGLRLGKRVLGVLDMLFAPSELLHQFDSQLANAVELFVIRRRPAPANNGPLGEQRLQYDPFGGKDGLGQECRIAELGELVVREGIGSERESLTLCAEGEDLLEVFLVEVECLPAEIHSPLTFAFPLGHECKDVNHPGQRILAAGLPRKRSFRPAE